MTSRLRRIDKVFPEDQQTVGRGFKMRGRLDVTILLPPKRGELVPERSPIGEGLQLRSADALGLLSLNSNFELEGTTTLSQPVPTFTKVVTGTKTETIYEPIVYNPKYKLTENPNVPQYLSGVKYSEGGGMERVVKEVKKTRFKRTVKVPYQAGGTRFGTGTATNALSGLALSRDVSDMADLGDTAYIAQIDVLQASWRRNPLSEPDELTVTIHADALGGLDLRLIRAIQVDFWLFTPTDYEDDANAMANRMRGEPGYFGGICQTINQSRFENTLELSCLDYTHLLQSQELNGSVAQAIDLGSTLVDVVGKLVAAVPGGNRWEVVDASTLLDPKRGLAERLASEEALSNARLSSLTGEAAAREQTVNDALRASRIGLESGFDPGIGQTRLAAVMATNEFTFSAGGSRTSVWDAILRVCAIAGAVPEFAVSEKGAPTVYLVDASVLQAGRQGLQFRQFVRRDPDGTERFHRVLTVGQDVWAMEEDRRLETEVRVDRVDVVSYDPDTGRVLKGSYGTPGRKKSSAETVEVITAHGITSVERLDLIARNAYESRVGREYALQVQVACPWTTGGGIEDGPPDAPPDSRFDVLLNAGGEGLPSSAATNTNTSSDLLYCAAGVPIEIRFPGFDQRSMGGKTLQQDAQNELEARLGGRSLPWVADAAEAISSAMGRARLSTLFQVRAVEHEFSADDYMCTLDLQAFLEQESNDKTTDYPSILRDPTQFSLLDDELSL